jgi:hypothetical protein
MSAYQSQNDAPNNAGAVCAVPGTCGRFRKPTLIPGRKVSGVVWTNEMNCRRCGGILVESRDSVPYIAPGPCVVELRNISVRRCSACGDTKIHVPEPQALDTLVRCLQGESLRAMPHVHFENGQWHVVPRRGNGHAGA